MKIKLNEKQLSITFQYDVMELTQRIVTNCTIKDISNGERFDYARTISTSYSIQSKKEQHNKFLARKYALKYALKNGDFSKEDRKIIWAEYLKQVKLPKKI